jgi:hypothetical protein
LQIHGGLTPAALADVRLCTANRAFRTERGWRKPAVARECTQPVKNAPRRVRVSLARRANARRSCFARRYCPNMLRSALQARSIATHGGLTFTWKKQRIHRQETHICRGILFITRRNRTAAQSSGAFVLAIAKAGPCRKGQMSDNIRLPR